MARKIITATIAGIVGMMVILLVSAWQQDLNMQHERKGYRDWTMPIEHASTAWVSNDNETCPLRVLVERDDRTRDIRIVEFQEFSLEQAERMFIFVERGCNTTWRMIWR